MILPQPKAWYEDVVELVAAAVAFKALRLEVVVAPEIVGIDEGWTKVEVVIDIVFAPTALVEVKVCNVVVWGGP